MILIFFFIAGALAGVAINRANAQRVDDIVAAGIGAACIGIGYGAILILPLLLATIGYVLGIIALIGAAAALYLWLSR